MHTADAIPGKITLFPHIKCWCFIKLMELKELIWLKRLIDGDGEQ